VAVEGKGLLILGPSGSGKSSLALEMMALGAKLVSDDQVDLCGEGGALYATAPDRLRGMIEARGIGILGADPTDTARIVLAVDLAEREPDRLPPFREITILGCPIPLVLGRGAHHLSSALFQYLKGGRRA
jgi:HPr kinase/phosphorylase